MKLKQVSLFLSFCVFGQAFAFDPNLLTNNKEQTSHVLNGRALKKAHSWASSTGISESTELKSKIKMALDSSIKEMEGRSAQCDIGYYELLESELNNLGVLRSSKDMFAAVTFMREQNLIDDILYKILLNASKTAVDLKEIEISKVRVTRSDIREIEESGSNLEEVYSDFKTWPNEVSICSLGRFNNLLASVSIVEGKKASKEITKWNKVALYKKIISAETFYKLEVLKDNDVLNWNHYLVRYFEITGNAKDKLSTSEDPTSDERSSMPTKYVSRRQKLTHRGSLYQKYDSTQVMLLAGIIQKAARRLDATQVTINFEFIPDNSDETEDTEIYVLSPMERYRLAIKMLRKDMAELMKTDTFINNTVEYEDVVTAAFETGLIKSDELDHIVKLEEFWNPTVPKWKKYAGLTFSIVGTASFYLPPPWNIIAAVGLVVTQTKVMNSDSKPDSDDNWNSVI